MPDFDLSLRRCRGALLSCVTHRNTGAQHTRWHYEEEEAKAASPPPPAVVAPEEAAKGEEKKESPDAAWEMVPASV